jgi:hypothetical protein
MTNKEPSEKEIRDYLTFLSAVDGEGLARQLNSQDGKTEFENYLKKITGIGDAKPSLSIALEQALNLIVTSTDDKQYVINQIIERLSKFLKIKKDV